MSYDDDYDDELWQDHGDEEDDTLPCPECGTELHADADACPECGYWITESDRKAAWRAGSASGRIVTIGLWVIGAAVGVWLLMVFR